MEQSISNDELEVWKTAVWKAKEIVKEVFHLKEDNASYNNIVTKIALKIIDLEANSKDGYDNFILDTHLGIIMAKKKGVLQK